MPNILVVLGSARPGRVADHVLKYVEADFASRDDMTMTVADLKDLNLPFFDGNAAPMSEQLEITNENVKKWAKMVADADGVLFLMPEYNHTMTALQKNAIDWLYAEWNDKPVSVIAYGWSGGSLAYATAKEVLGNVKANLLTTPAQLAFMKQLNPDGTILDEATTHEAIATTIDELALACEKVPVAVA